MRQEIGLGRAESIQSVTVRWPSGTKQIFGGIKIDRIQILKEGDPKVRVWDLKTFQYDLSRPPKSHLHGGAG